MNSQKPLRLAIIGGGLAGATLMNALMTLPHLSLSIYESAPQFSERGAAVGLSINAQRALSEIGSGVTEALDKAGAVSMNSMRSVIGSGPDAGTVLFDLSKETQPRIVARRALLSELLKPVPQHMMHTSKKLTQITELPTGEVELSFRDGSIETVDALIGADGIHGYVREFILGAEHPALKPSFAGFWDCRALVPIERAREVLGEEWFKEPRQYAWTGDGGFIMHDVLDNGETVQCVGAVVSEDWDPAQWKKDLDRKTLERAFERWKESPIVEGMITLLLENPDLCRVCIMGDAAHAMTPWQGSGAGQTIEDAMILQTLLREVKEPEQLDAAFRAYDEVRRPRTQRVVASSKVSGGIMCGRGDGIGLDVDKLREKLPVRWKFIHELDMKEHKKAALMAMKKS